MYNNKYNFSKWLLGILILSGFMIFIALSFTNAASLTETKQYNDIQKKVYILDTNGTINADFQLLWNTPNCGGDQECYAIIKANVYKKKQVILNDLEFKDLKDKKKTIFINYTVDAYTYDKKGNKITADSNSEVVYYRISTYKNPKDSIDWIPTLYGYKIDEWDVWGAQLTYDDFNDGALNQVLFNASLSGSGTYNPILNESNGRATAYCEWSASGDCNFVELNTTAFPNYENIENISIGSYLAIYYGGGVCNDVQALINVYGTDVFSITTNQQINTSTLFIRRNYSSPTVKFSRYVDQNYLGDFTPVNGAANIKARIVGASNPSASCFSTGTGNYAGFDYIYYVRSGDLNTTLVSPLNYTWVKSPITFNFSVMSIGGLTNASLYGNWSGGWHLNQTINITGSSNSSNFTANLPEGNYDWNVETQNQINNISFGANNLTIRVDNTAPTIVINTPTGTVTSKTFNVDITANDSLSGLNYCYFNITRGASVEVVNTQITNCTTVSTTVSADASYVINVWANDSANNQNTTNQSFTVASTGQVGGAGGGGGGGSTTIIQQLTSPIKASLCNPTYPKFTDAYQIFRKEPTFENFKGLWFSYWDYTLCKSAASIIPLE